MKIISALVFMFGWCTYSYSDSIVYYDLQKALKNPLLVERLVLLNMYTEVPEEVRKFVNLKELYLGQIIDHRNDDFQIENNRFNDVINSQFKCRYLKNELSNLPEWLPELKHLKILFITNNHFIKYPKVLNRMDELEILDMSFNSLTELNCSIPNLKEFYVSLNQDEYSDSIFILPSEITVLCITASRLISSQILKSHLKLKEIILNGVIIKQKFILNDLNSTIESVSIIGSTLDKFQVNNSYRLSKLKYLKISGFLEKYDWICTTAINLECLDLSINSIDSIKSDFKFKYLHSVKFDHGKIKYVDSTFFQNNPNLNTVSFYDNNIKSIYVNNIDNLEYLSLTDNDISEIFISKFNKLKYLSYRGNEISFSNVPIEDLFIIPHLELLLCINKFKKYKYKGPNYISVNYSDCD